MRKKKDVFRLPESEGGGTTLLRNVCKYVLADMVNIPRHLNIQKSATVTNVYSR